MITNEPIRIAVIIVVLNGDKTLRRAIESVVCQTYPFVDLIIIDGDSTYNTLAIINEYAKKINYFISRKDSGIYYAINDALDKCGADWCLFLGCDDVLLDCFHLVVNKITDREAIYYGQIIRRSNGSIYNGKYNKIKLTLKNICHQSIFYPRNCFKYAYDTKYRLLADYKQNIKLWGLGIRFIYIPYIISNYNDTGSASTGDMVFLADKTRILNEHLGFFYGNFWQIREFFANIYRYFKYKKYKR